MSVSGAIKRVSKSSFEWIIPYLRDKIQHEGDSIRSAVFHQPDSSWHFFLCLASENTIEIYLRRSDEGPTKTITCTIKVKGRTDIVEVTSTNYSCSKHAPPQYPIISLNEHFRSSFPIICCITFGRPHLVAGKEILTCAVKTVVEENPKEEDCSSLDMKDLLVENLRDLIASGANSDVELNVGGKMFKAHKAIVCARCPVFSSMFQHDMSENKSGVVEIPDCSPDAFNVFLRYLYTGETEDVDVADSKLVRNLYYIADKYNVLELKGRCSGRLAEHLSVENFCDVVALALRHSESGLLKSACEFFTLNVKAVITTARWKTYLTENPIHANELYIKAIDAHQLKDACKP